MRFLLCKPDHTNATVMQKFWKYAFPPLYGLIIYITIRLVNDTVTGFKFWLRPWHVTAIEVAASSVIGYLLLYIFNRVEHTIFSKNSSTAISKKSVATDFLRIYGFCFLVVNAIAVPVASLTDDGLSWFDFIHINTIPMLYLLLYFAIRRGNFYLQGYVQQAIYLEKAHSEQLETELKYLKNQLHPHFLFNAINTVYFQMDESVQEAKTTLENLSELLRYQLYLPEKSTVPLQKEVEHLEHYLHLQKARSPERLLVEIDLKELKNSSLPVYPLLLFPLAENAFKHIGGTDPVISINGSMNGNELRFEVKNTFEEGKTTVLNGGGLGINNLKRRLELLMPNHYRLSLEKENGCFTATLSIGHVTIQSLV